MNTFLSQNIAFVLLIGLANVFSFLFQIVVARGLTPADYGTFNTLYAFTAFFGILCTSIPPVLAKFMIQFRLESQARASGLATYSLQSSVLLGLVVFGVISLAAPLIMDFIHIDSTGSIVLMAALMGVSVYYPISRGLLQGLQRYSHIGVLGLLISASKFLLVFPLVFWLGLGVDGPLWSTLLSWLLGLPLCLYLLGDNLSRPRIRPDRAAIGKMARFTWPTLLMVLGTGWLGTIDLILAKHFCTPTESGYYATAAVLGRIPFYLSGMLIQVLFPEAVKSCIKGCDGIRDLLTSMGLTVLLAGGFALTASIWARPLILLLYGDQYLPATPIFVVTSIAMTFLALVNVMFSYALAYSRFGFLWILMAGFAGMFTAVGFMHDDPMQIASIVLATTFSIALVTAAWIVLNRKHWAAALR